jgi:hypothetical protein
LNGATPIAVCVNCGLNPTFDFPVTLPAASGCADQVVTLQASDNDGATAFARATIHLDATPSVLRCPSNLVVLCATGPDGALFETPVTAADDCPGPVMIVCDPPLGSFLHPGVTGVSCFAEDSCGNVSVPCNFSVTVDPTPPSSVRVTVIERLPSGDQPIARAEVRLI